MEAVVGASAKLTKALTGVDDDSKEAGAAIKALGLDLDRFYPELKNCMLVCVTEMNTRQDIEKLAEAMGE